MAEDDGYIDWDGVSKDSAVWRVGGTPSLVTVMSRMTEQMRHIQEAFREIFNTLHLESCHCFCVRHREQSDVCLGMVPMSAMIPREFCGVMVPMCAACASLEGTVQLRLPTQLGITQED